MNSGADVVLLNFVVVFVYNGHKYEPGYVVDTDLKEDLGQKYVNIT